jgi:hypothetical protein
MPCPNSARERCVTVAFRVSPAEAAEIDALVAASGMTKQDYIVDRLHNREVHLKSNARAYKGLSDIMGNIYVELRRLRSRDQITERLEVVLEDLTNAFLQFGTPDSVLKHDKAASSFAALSREAPEDFSNVSRG